MKTLSTLQVCRAVAALLVAFQHASSLYEVHSGRSDFNFMFRLGPAGIAFFFVLSGFILAWVHERDFDRPATLGNYARKRLLRIYPLYLLVSLALLPFWLASAASGESVSRKVAVALKSLVLFPQEQGPFLKAGWTLSHELFFYLVFALLFVWRRGAVALLALWAVAIVVFEVCAWNTHYPSGFFFNAFNVLFPAGVLTALLARHAMRRGWLNDARGLALFVAGSLGFIATACGPRSCWSGFPGVLLFGAASMAITAGAMSAHTQEFFARRKVWLLLGDASYAIYLAHYPVISLGGKVLDRLGLFHTAPVASYGLLVATGVAAGVALHVAVERPVQGLLKARFRPRA